MPRSQKVTQQQQGKEICGSVGHRNIVEASFEVQRLKRGGQQDRSIATISLLRTEQLSRRSLVDTAARRIRGPIRFYRRRCVRSPPRSGHDPSFTAVLRSEKGGTL